MDKQPIKILKRQKEQDVPLPESKVQLELKIVFNDAGRRVVTEQNNNNSKNRHSGQIPPTEFQNKRREHNYIRRRSPIEIPAVFNPIHSINKLMLSINRQNINDSIKIMFNLPDFHTIECYEICINAIHQRLLSVTDKVPTICYIKIIDAIRAQNRLNIFEVIERKLNFSAKIFIYLLQRKINKHYVDDIGFGESNNSSIVSELETISLPKRLYRIYCFLMESYLMKFISGGPILECLSGLECEIENGQKCYKSLMKLLLNQTLTNFIEKYPEYIEKLSTICKGLPVDFGAIEIDEQTLNRFASIQLLEEHMLWLKVTVPNEPLKLIHRKIKKPSRAQKDKSKFEKLHKDLGAGATANKQADEKKMEFRNRDSGDGTAASKQPGAKRREWRNRHRRERNKHDK